MRKHRPISRTFWQRSQKQILDRWKEKNLQAERKKDEEAYLPLLLKYAEDLPQDGAVLEIGCGPVCLSQSLPLKNKTFLDPLLDDFRRMYPGELREGEYLTTSAERVPKANNSYDLIICMNTISYSLHPELIMNEMERLLKPEGRLIVAMHIHSQLEARLHYWATQYMPALCYGTQPNFYSRTGIQKTLARHFKITDEIVICEQQRSWLPFIRREERLFICTNLANKTSSL